MKGSQWAEPAAMPGSPTVLPFRAASPVTHRQGSAFACPALNSHMPEGLQLSSKPQLGSAEEDRDAWTNWRLLERLCWGNHLFHQA